MSSTVDGVSTNNVSVAGSVSASEATSVGDIELVAISVSDDRKLVVVVDSELVVVFRFSNKRLVSAIISKVVVASEFSGREFSVVANTKLVVISGFTDRESVAGIGSELLTVPSSTDVTVTVGKESETIELCMTELAVELDAEGPEVWKGDEELSSIIMVGVVDALTVDVTSNAIVVTVDTTFKSIAVEERGGLASTASLDVASSDNPVIAGKQKERAIN